MTCHRRHIVFIVLEDIVLLFSRAKSRGLKERRPGHRTSRSAFDCRTSHVAPANALSCCVIVVVVRSADR